MNYSRGTNENNENENKEDKKDQKNETKLSIFDKFKLFFKGKGARVISISALVLFTLLFYAFIDRPSYLVFFGTVFGIFLFEFPIDYDFVKAVRNLRDRPSN